MTPIVSAVASLRRRTRRSSLGLKLAALGGAVTALVVWIAFWALSVQIRANTRDSFANELSRNQRTLQHLQTRNASQLLFGASLIAQSPSFLYSLKTYQVEVSAGQRPDERLVIEIEEELGRLSQVVEADLLLVTDDSGRVFASAGPHAAAVPRGTSVASLAAMRLALDPNARADAGGLAVLRVGQAYIETAVYPLVQDGFTVGGLLVGERVDSAFVASARAASDADVVLTAGKSIITATDRALAGASMGALLDAHARDSATTTIRLAGEEYVAAPVWLGETQEHEAVRLWILQPLTRTVAALTRPLRRVFLLYGALAVLVAGIGAVFTARTVLGPFQRFVRYMRSGAATEQRSAPFEADGEALEVRTLNESFGQLMGSLAGKRRELEERTAELAAANVVLTDEISERIRVEQALRESEAQLRQSQKLEAIGTLAGGIAHDFNNLITVISGYTQLALMRSEQNSSTADDLQQVVEASDRAANLTHQLLAFSRKQVLQPTVLDLGDVVKGIAPMLRRIIGEHIVLRIETGASLARVRADRGQLEQVLLNLAVNARDAMTGGGTLTIATANVFDSATPPDADRDEARAVSLAVSDTGQGMTDDVRDRIFEPFFTTKEAGKGTGLGLSTVYGIVKQSDGTIAVNTAPGKGTTFTISLPPAQTMAVTEIAAPDDSELPRGTETILIVEDAEDVRILARRSLVERGYKVLAARNAAEALEIGAAGTIDVLLTDIVMPNTSGPQLVAEYVAIRRAPIVIYMSGYADDALVRYELDPNVVFLRKPFTPAVLARTVRAALDAAHAGANDDSAETGGADVGSAAD
ncbi:MAG: ATP-binding protein [bacterium]